MLTFGLKESGSRSSAAASDKIEHLRRTEYFPREVGAYRQDLSDLLGNPP